MTKIKEIVNEEAEISSQKANWERPEPVRKKSKINWWVIIVLVILLLGGGFYYTRYNNTDVEAKRVEKENQKIVADVRKLIIIPETLKPQIMQIEDPEVLVRQQTFFAGSVKGDYLLIYPELSKAIVYSPSRNIIVNVGPITQEPALPQSPNSNDSAEQTPPAPVESEIEE